VALRWRSPVLNGGYESDAWHHSPPRDPAMARRASDGKWRHVAQGVEQLVQPSVIDAAALRVTYFS
jgi:hypothetical protein